MELPPPLSRRIHEQWAEKAHAAKDHADQYLRDVDAALADEEEVQRMLQRSVEYGNLTPEERDEYLASYHRERFREVWPDAS